MTEQQRAAGEAAPAAGADDTTEAPARDGSASGASVPEAAGEPAAPEAPAVTEDTVEALVRSQLSKALGGKRGMVEARCLAVAFEQLHRPEEDLAEMTEALLVGGVRRGQRLGLAIGLHFIEHRTLA